MLISYKMFLANVIFLSLVSNVFGAIRWSRQHLWDVPDYRIKVYCDRKSLVLDRALQTIVANTCVRFKKLNKRLEVGNGINIIKNNSLCYSDRIGAHYKDAPNIIWASDECLNDYFKILGVLLNALGLNYEHSRNDRDSYVKVFPENAIEEYRDFVFKTDKELGYNTTTFGTSYDYGSILHGHPRYYSQTRNKTITLKGLFKVWNTESIGYPKKESFNEFRLINYLYCNQTCRHQPLSEPCKFSGYQDPNACWKCKCPYFTKGTYCGEKQHNRYECHPTALHAKHNVQKEYYTHHKECFIYIRADYGQKVKLTITYLYIYWHYDNTPCARGDYRLEVMYKKDKSIMGVCFCEYINYGLEIISEDFEVFLVYYGSSFRDYVYFNYMAIS
uniref:Metalloendopeptidase n=1 Tax=Parastrongyloides trichosuri TaxID=131310 RepID=A0A0N4Z6C6_PARTI